MVDGVDTIPLTLTWLALMVRSAIPNYEKRISPEDEILHGQTSPFSKVRPGPLGR